MGAAPFVNVMVSSRPPGRPEWITQWLVAPIWVNVAPGQLRSRRTAVASAGGEVHDGVAVGLPGVEHEGVVAAIAREPVGAGAPVEGVLAGIAEELVGSVVAGAGEVGRALQHQGVHIGGQRLVHGGEYRIGAFAGVLEHEVAGVVDEVDVVAQSRRA